MKKIHSFLIISICLAFVFQACEKEVPPELTLTATQLTIDYGTTATISWVAENAASCTMDAGVITGVQGLWVTPPLVKTTTYTFTATGSGGTVTQTITITVNAALKPTLKVTVDNDTIGKGQTVNLLIESTNAVNVKITGGINDVTFPLLNGSFTSWPLHETTQFTITATGVDGSIAVAEPVIVVPTGTDTLCGRYWMMIEKKTFYLGEWITWDISEKEKALKTYFYTNGITQSIDPDGKIVGSCNWSWIGEKDSIINGTQRLKYELTDTTFSYIGSYQDKIAVVKYKGYRINK